MFHRPSGRAHRLLGASLHDVDALLCALAASPYVNATSPVSSRLLRVLGDGRPMHGVLDPQVVGRWMRSLATATPQQCHPRGGAEVVHWSSNSGKSLSQKATPPGTRPGWTGLLMVEVGLWFFGFIGGCWFLGKWCITTMK